MSTLPDSIEDTEALAQDYSWAPSPLTPSRRAGRYLRSNPLILIGIVISLLWVVAALLAPLIAPYAPLHVGSSRVDLQACKLEYSIVSPK